MYMQKKIKEVTFLFPKETEIEPFLKQRATEPFSDEACLFLNALSHELSKDIRTYPEVAALAFFCRRANVLQLKKKYGQGNDSFRLGRGIVFHIAPSNVPLNFAYSLVCGILSGNCNIVRAPSKEFEQVSIVCEALERIRQSGEHKTITNRLLIVRYNRQNQATEYFSSVCDVRVIWGGDDTIAQIRKNSIPARAFDVTFADRFSLCVIEAGEYLKEKDIARIAVGFYNDTYLFDQNACTSPHLIVWLGDKEEVARAKEIFWSELHKVVIAKYTAMQPVIAVDKLTSFYSQAALSGVANKITTADNFIWRVQTEELPNDIDTFRCAGGYFTEYDAESLSELNKVINRTYQTMAYYGVSKETLIDFIKENMPSGIDRIVPIGRTAEFSLNWDGFELITTLSRSIDIL
jgi:hypothetical protein